MLYNTAICYLRRKVDKMLGNGWWHGFNERHSSRRWRTGCRSPSVTPSDLTTIRNTYFCVILYNYHIVRNYLLRTFGVGRHSVQKIIFVPGTKILYPVQKSSKLIQVLCFVLLFNTFLFTVKTCQSTSESSTMFSAERMHL